MLYCCRRTHNILHSCNIFSSFFFADSAEDSYDDPDYLPDSDSEMVPASVVSSDLPRYAGLELPSAPVASKITLLIRFVQ